MKKKLLLLLFLPFMLASCASVQVFEVSSPNVENYEGDVFASENEDLAIAYDFWADGGILIFNVTNKTNQDIYIDFSKSSYLINGEVYDFYEDLYSPPVALIEEEMIPSRIEKIPSQSSETIEGFPVTFDWHSLRNNRIAVYGEEESPFQFSNRIVYSNDDDFQEERYLQNDFWVSYVEKMKKRSFKAYANSSIPKSNKFYVRKYMQGQPAWFWIDVGLAVLETAIYIGN